MILALEFKQIHLELETFSDAFCDNCEKDNTILKLLQLLYCLTSQKVLYLYF